MMSRVKELEDENRRLKKMYLEEKLKAEVANEYLKKNSTAVSQARDGQRDGSTARRGYSAGTRSFFHQ